MLSMFMLLRAYIFLLLSTNVFDDRIPSEVDSIVYHHSCFSDVFITSFTPPLPTKLPINFCASSSCNYVNGSSCSDVSCAFVETDHLNPNHSLSSFSLVSVLSLNLQKCYIEQSLYNVVLSLRAIIIFQCSVLSHQSNQ